jgi:hypothetical protein
MECFGTGTVSLDIDCIEVFGNSTTFLGINIHYSNIVTVFAESFSDVEAHFAYSY